MLCYLAFYIYFLEILELGDNWSIIDHLAIFDFPSKFYKTFTTDLIYTVNILSLQWKKKQICFTMEEVDLIALSEVALF